MEDSSRIKTAKKYRSYLNEICDLADIIQEEYTYYFEGDYEEEEGYRLSAFEAWKLAIDIYQLHSLTT